MMDKEEFDENMADSKQRLLDYLREKKVITNKKLTRVENNIQTAEEDFADDKEIY